MQAPIQRGEGLWGLTSSPEKSAQNFGHLMDAILAGFSVEMILIAQTVFFTLIFVIPLLMS